MKPAFTNSPEKENMVTEMDKLAIKILCVACGWEGKFEDGSTDHFFNHTCKLRTQSIGSDF